MPALSRLNQQETKKNASPGLGLARARHPRPGAVRGPLGVSGPIYLGANDIYLQKPERTLKLNFRLNFTHKWNLGVGGSQEVMS